MRRERRTRKEILEAKITELDASIQTTRDKLTRYKEEKKELSAQLDEILKAEERSAKKAELREISKFLEQQNISVEDLKAILQKESEE